MPRIALSVVLGLFSPFVFILGAEPFEVIGRTSSKEVIGGCVALVLYLTICEFLLARTERRSLRRVWPTMAGMTAPLLIWFVIIAVVEKRGVVYAQAIPMLLFGILAVFAGAGIAMRGSIGAHQ